MKTIQKIRTFFTPEKAMYCMAILSPVAIQLMLKQQAKKLLTQNSGENFIESALKILIAVVIGALLLAGLYLLFNGTVLPTLTQKIKDLFNYGG